MSNRDETVTLAAKEALGLAGSYRIAHAVMPAFSTSKGLPMLVGAVRKGSYVARRPGLLEHEPWEKKCTPRVPVS